MGCEGLPINSRRGRGLQSSGPASHNPFSLSHALTSWMNSAGRSMLGE